MVHQAIIKAVAALLLALPVCNAGLYPKNSAVLQLNEKSYDRLIARSNYTSIVEFYAPWCGHCKTLQPAYEKAAKALAGLAKVAAVDCDEDSNKKFCGSMGIQGFPTLKIVKPGKKPGNPIVEDYQGPREAKPIIEIVKSKMPNHVTKLTDSQVEKFLSEKNETVKAILFTDKKPTSALLKAVAVEFLGSIQVAQIRNTEKETVELFGITKYPTVVLLPGGPSAEGIVFEGEITKTALVTFLSQIATPNPDPAPPVLKMPKKGEQAGKGAHKPAEGTESAARAAAETVEEASKPTDPIIIPDFAPPIPVLVNKQELASLCMAETSGTCVLAFVPTAEDEHGAQLLKSLAEIDHKHNQAKRKIFPFYAIPDENPDSQSVKRGLRLVADVALIALNRKRGWWKRYENFDMSTEAVEVWIDAIRMGEGEKLDLPEITIIDKTKRPIYAQPGERHAPGERPVPVEKEAPVQKEAVESTTESPPPVDEADESTTESATPLDEVPEVSTTTVTVEEVEQTKEPELPEHNEL